jgi:hypothetical protein
MRCRLKDGVVLMILILFFILMFSVAPYAERYLGPLNDKEAWQRRYFQAGTRRWFFGVFGVIYMFKIFNRSVCVIATLTLR